MTTADPPFWKTKTLEQMTEPNGKACATAAAAAA